MRAALSLLLPAVALANHLDGPMQDRLDHCEVTMCPGSLELFTSMGEDSTFEVKKWLTDADYVFGLTSKYPELQGAIDCVCNQCSNLVEAIWQPVGREACGRVGATLPCQKELDACVARYDLASCAPGHSIFAYKHAYDLSSTAECQSICRNEAGENAPPCNPKDEIIVLNECLATHRTFAGEEAVADVILPCDRNDPANEKKICQGIPATKCEALPACGWNGVSCCFYEGTMTPCNPNGRRLLFGGNYQACVCN